MGRKNSPTITSRFGGGSMSIVIKKAQIILGFFYNGCQSNLNEITFRLFITCFFHQYDGLTLVLACNRDVDDVLFE